MTAISDDKAPMPHDKHILRQRAFLPLFVTQLFNAFNDNLYKNAMVLFVVYSVYNSEAKEAAFSAVASGLFILPFFLFSAFAGQLADMRDKAKIIRIVKFCEIIIMTVGAIGLTLANNGIAVSNIAIPVMLLALLAMGVHSTFFGPIKYAIIPQSLPAHKVLEGTGWVEAGTYLAILAGTILAGLISVEAACIAIIITAVIGWLSSLSIPSAPPLCDGNDCLDWNIFRSSRDVVRDSMKNREVFYAILSISFFWAIATVIFVQFIPLAKNVLHAGKDVASLFLVVFSIGIAIGSIAINRLLKGVVSARYSPASVVIMGIFLAGFYLLCHFWPKSGDEPLYTIPAFLMIPQAAILTLILLAIAISGGMFVVPLYAFLTTKVPPDMTSRTIAANNLINSGAMVMGSLVVMAMTYVGIAISEQLLFTASMCLVSSWMARKLCNEELRAAGA